VGDEPDHRALIADLRARLAEAWGREQGERVRLVSQERDAEKARADAACEQTLRYERATGEMQERALTAHASLLAALADGARLRGALEGMPRSAVLALAFRMEDKLQRHDGRRGADGWKDDDPLALMRRLDEEVAELRSAVVAGDIAGEWDRDAVANEAADVANFAMFVADVIGGLGHHDRLTGLARAALAGADGGDMGEILGALWWQGRRWGHEHPDALAGDDETQAAADAALDAALRDLPRPSQAPLEALVRAVFTAGWAASHQHDADQWIAGGLEGPFEEQPCCREALAGHLADIPALLRKVAP